jgi:hypothetical protein
MGGMGGGYSAAEFGRVTWDSPEVEYLNVYLYGDENQTFKNRLQEGYREGLVRLGGGGGCCE